MKLGDVLASAFDLVVGGPFWCMTIVHFGCSDPDCPYETTFPDARHPDGPPATCPLCGKPVHYANTDTMFFVGDQELYWGVDNRWHKSGNRQPGVKLRYLRDMLRCIGRNQPASALGIRS